MLQNGPTKISKCFTCNNTDEPDLNESRTHIFFVFHFDGILKISAQNKQTQNCRAVEKSKAKSCFRLKMRDLNALQMFARTHAYNNVRTFMETSVQLLRLLYGAHICTFYRRKDCFLKMKWLTLRHTCTHK